MVGRVDHQRLVLVEVVDDRSLQEEQDEQLVILELHEHLIRSELVVLAEQQLVEEVEVAVVLDSIK